MNMTWIFGWHVKMQTNEWLYNEILDETDPLNIQILGFQMVDNIRDALWQKLDINWEDEQIIQGVFE